jgi:hypothetical protein
MPLTTVNPALLDTQAQYTGFKSRIINGAMVIDQRNAGASVSNAAAANTYFIDRWTMFGAAASRMTGQRSTTAPVGFTNSALITSSAATTPGAGDAYGVRQYIEGLNMADLGWGTANAQTVTVSFWVRSSITGTYSFALFNSDNTRSYVATYSISSANTWEQKAITIAGDTTGTWLTTNGIGTSCWWDLGSGTNFNTTAGSWGSVLYVRTSGSANWIGTNGATFYITGVQLEKGSTATSFDYRPYGTELVLCQRYCELILNSSLGLWIDATTARVYPKYQVRKRSNISASLTTTTPYAEQIGVVGLTGSGSTVTVNSSYLDGGDFSVTGFSGRTYGQFAFVNGSVFLVTAEL